MAEGWLRHFLGDGHRICSAGVEPTSVNPTAIAVMAEADIDISQQQSEHVTTYINDEFDHVITVCDHALKNCPVFPGNAQALHHGFSDPSLFSGTEEEVLSTFRAVRDQIRDFCWEFIHKG